MINLDYEILLCFKLDFFITLNKLSMQYLSGDINDTNITVYLMLHFIL